MRGGWGKGGRDGWMDGGREAACMRRIALAHRYVFYCKQHVASMTFVMRILRSPESQNSRINSRYLLHVNDAETAVVQTSVWCRVVRCVSSDVVWINTGNITLTLP